MDAINSKKINVASFARSFGWSKLTEKILALIIAVSLFIPWFFYPLSNTENAFQFQSHFYISYGYLLLILLVIYMLGLRLVLPLIILVVFSFPLKLFGDYWFLELIIDQINQTSNLMYFAQNYIYEPNIVNYEIKTKLDFFTLPYSDTISRSLFLVQYLGFGYILAFFCSIFFLFKLRFKEYLFLAVFIFLLVLPTLFADYFLFRSEKNLLLGNYKNSDINLRKAKKSSELIWDSNLSNTEFFNYLLGESLYRNNNKQLPESYFFLGKKEEQEGSFNKALKFYTLADRLAPTQRAIPRTIIKKVLFDSSKKNLDFSLPLLSYAYSLNPDRIETNFYLLNLSYKSKKFDSGIRYGEFLIENSGNNILLSDVYNAIAKIYGELDQKQLSRDMYKKSLDHYDGLRKGNYHAWKGLAGW